MPLTESDLQPHLDRRRPGQNSLTTPRCEKDQVVIQSGTEGGKTLGTPICCVVENENVYKKDYSKFNQIPRPGHADYTYMLKYGTKASSGGGRSSARETIGRVCAGAIAEKYLSENFGTKFISWVDSVSDVSIPPEDKPGLLNELSEHDRQEIDRRGTFIVLQNEDKRAYIDYQSVLRDQQGKEIKQLDQTANEIYQQIEEEKFLCEDQGEIYKFEEIINIRCPHPATAVKMIEKIKEAKGKNDSVGGIATGMIVNCPKGLGEPCFEKFEALLGMAMLSLPATKGFEFGSGFEGTKLFGSAHNDLFSSCSEEEIKHEKISTEIKSKNPYLETKTNNAGGTLGGITNGNIIYFRVAVKPVSSISVEQQTCDFKGESKILEAKGRHDPCVLARIVPIIEAMSSLVTMDCTLQQLARKASSEVYLEDWF
ncbi:unnamed protein product [Moneuplotes crassus]|uniref:chorismate synthase n=1 Tax=Euplotes crassus TaxID=5936 RepID=A0AAD1UEX2_EUPCR|nr:unnamed protein product [Moneuplotes crassus]